jgi:hypothetical protein
VTLTPERSSYHALRLSPGAEDDGWWSAARRRPDTPRAIAVLLAGRSRIEVSRDEAAHALAWAEGVEGWVGADPKPLVVYPADPPAGRARGDVA